MEWVLSNEDMIAGMCVAKAEAPILEFSMVWTRDLEDDDNDRG